MTPSSSCYKLRPSSSGYSDAGALSSCYKLRPSSSGYSDAAALDCCLSTPSHSTCVVAGGPSYSSCHQAPSHYERLNTVERQLPLIGHSPAGVSLAVSRHDYDDDDDDDDEDDDGGADAADQLLQFADQPPVPSLASLRFSR